MHRPKTPIQNCLGKLHVLVAMRVESIESVGEIEKLVEGVEDGAQRV